MGQPRSYITGAAGRARATGATPNLAETGNAKGIKVWGNSNRDRRHSRMADAKGQPEAADAGSEERERRRGDSKLKPGLRRKIW
jgi:hypothetical protein